MYITKDVNYLNSGTTFDPCDNNIDLTNTV